jgi:ankyrin repeat protein
LSENKNEYSLCGAIANGDIEYVKTSLLKGVIPNFVCEKSGHSLLNIAVENKQQEIIKLLLLNGADINFKSYGGWTPLHVAVDISIDGTIQTGGNTGDEPTDIIQYLLVHGADKNILNCNSNTPLDIAKEYHSQKIVNFLAKTKRFKI